MKGKKINSVRKDGSEILQGLCVNVTDEEAFESAVKFSQDNPTLTVVVRAA